MTRVLIDTDLQALRLEGQDFEDSMVIYAAMSNKVDNIITRNTKDFANSSIKTLTPEKFLKPV